MTTRSQIQIPCVFSHPVDEEGLGELDDLKGHQQTDGDQVVEENDEGEEVEVKVRRTAICQGDNKFGGDRGAIDKTFVNVESRQQKNMGKNK
jgi:hypothetical protein